METPPCGKPTTAASHTNVGSRVQEGEEFNTDSSVTRSCLQTGQTGCLSEKTQNGNPCEPATLHSQSSVINEDADSEELSTSGLSLSRGGTDQTTFKNENSSSRAAVDCDYLSARWRHCYCTSWQGTVEIYPPCKQPSLVSVRILKSISRTAGWYNLPAGPDDENCTTEGILPTEQTPGENLSQFS
ncbi:hypothetical protein RvY_04250 [Ramazzottius varieornatus]|uniref:Uncharacterized protein n=1 Tax=Ramazzottius varieornatus TaxID=947166 RepID=A0A1D1UWS5_RAMVA|nr:hypothetical protein RvY_04250 [Ramazzottius varieornatus]